MEQRSLRVFAEFAGRQREDVTSFAECRSRDESVAHIDAKGGLLAISSVKGKRGRIPNTVAPILERWKLNRKTWCELVGTFGKRFFHVTGQPATIDATPSRMSQHRYYIPSQTRELLQDAPHPATP